MKALTNIRITENFVDMVSRTLYKSDSCSQDYRPDGNGVVQKDNRFVVAGQRTRKYSVNQSADLVIGYYNRTFWTAPLKISPNKSRLFPTKARVVPTGTGLFPTEAGEFPIEAGEFPTESGLFPTEAGFFPIDSELFPTETGLFPTGTGLFPAETEQFPTESGLFPTESGEFPIETGLFPTESGEFPTAIRVCVQMKLFRKDDYSSSTSHRPIITSALPNTIICGSGDQLLLFDKNGWAVSKVCCRVRSANGQVECDEISPYHSSDYESDSTFFDF